jgi:hypothetical protein
MLRSLIQLKRSFGASTPNSGHRSIASGLRHRYCLLHLTSDFCGGVVPGNDRDAHKMFLMINQIPLGKAIHGRVLYSRATRHKDVRLYCVAALSFYLQFRFHVTEEFLNFIVDDWTINSKWFDVKLLVDVAARDLCGTMQNGSFSNKLKTILTITLR